MRPLTFLFFTALLCPAQSSSRGEVERIYQAVRTATEKHDVAAFEKLLTKDFVFISRNGQTDDRDSFLARQKAGQMLAGINPEIVSIRVYGDSAIVMSRFVLAAKSETAQPTTVLSSHFFVKQDGVWKWASHGATIVTAAAGK
jgi:hypothetical protein